MKLKRPVFAILILLSFGLNSCSINIPTKNENNTVKNNSSNIYSMNIGDTKKIKDTNYSLKLISLINDSRCPIDVTCIQKGTAKFSFTIFENDKEIETIEVTDESKSIIDQKYEIKIESVLPSLKESTKISSEEYEVNFSINKIEEENNNSSDKYNYSLPLKVKLEGECNMGDKVKYEINEDGTFKYSSSDNDYQEFETKTLDKTQIDELIKLIEEINIADLAEGDKEVPEGSPQTEECRTVSSYIINVNGKEESFDSNGRKLIHTEEYREAIKKLSNKIEILKNEDVNQKKDKYTLPLSVSLEGECGLGSFVKYKITENGILEETSGPDEERTVSAKNISSQDLTELKELLNEIDIANLAKKDEKVPEDSPQTKECRTVSNYIMNVDDQETSFDYNSRDFIHTKEYKEALDKLRTKIEELKK